MPTAAIRARHCACDVGTRLSAGGGGRIEIRSLGKYYGDQQVLRGIDLTIEAGEFFSLLGPSGCGKTTTLRMIGGFEPIEIGSIRIDGVDMAGVTPERRPVNTVFQNYALFPHQTVEQNVGFGLRFQDCIEAGALRVGSARRSSWFDSSSFAGRRPHQLSGGQQQRVALARALVLRPKVLLLDEPLGALDAKLRRTLQFELKELHREVGITFVYVTHDQEEALTMSDRLAVMNEGEIEQIGAPQRGLRLAGVDLRRRLPRARQPAAGDGAGRRHGRDRRSRLRRRRPATRRR